MREQLRSLQGQGRAKREIIYVIPEYPVISQTFVENEMLKIEELGFLVTIFPIHFHADRPGKMSNVITFRSIICNFRMWPSLALVILSLLKNSGRIFMLFRVSPFTVKSLGRMVFALGLSVALSTYLTSRYDAVRYLHAHFLGRALDVVTFTKIVHSDIKTSATAHAADASRPECPGRLRIQVSMLDKVVSASESVGTALWESTGRRPTGVIHCGIVPHVRSDLAQNKSGGRVLHILSVGRTVEKKGFDDCILAARRLVATGIPFQWKIIGDGPLDSKLRALSADLVASGHMQWLGAQSNSFVKDLLNSWAEVFVLPSKLSETGDVDGIPVAIMEAMTCAILPISSRISGIPELVVDGQTGLLIEAGDFIGLQQAIERVACEPNLRVELGNRAKNFVDVNFNQMSEARKLASSLFDD